jgi:predicted DNA-binding transcriptional regulator AlpA
MSADQWLCTKEVAQIIGFSAATLKRWRAVGTGPRHAVIGRSVRYRLRDVEAWLQTMRRDGERHAMMK